MIPSRLGLPFLLGVTLAFACGDDEVSFNPKSVPPDKQIDELDPMEQEEFCDEAREWAEEFFASSLPRLLCRAEGFSQGAGPSGFDANACKAAERQCLENPPDELDPDTDDLTCNVDQLGPDCDVTVREFADCLEQAVELNNFVLAEFTCDDIASGNIPSEEDFRFSAKCESLFERCGSTDSQETEPAPPPPG